jgi:hypothetical protein
MCIGLVQAANSELSKLHSKWFTPTPLSVPENSILTEFDDVFPPVRISELLPSITELMDVSGAIVSTVQPNDAGESSAFPTPS